MREHPSAGPTDNVPDTSTRPATYIALAALILLALIAVATFAERNYQVKPASGSAAAMSLAAEPHRDSAAAPLHQ